jgi:tetratricopeptide (TPR) repeat protein
MLLAFLSGLLLATPFVVFAQSPSARITGIHEPPEFTGGAKQPKRPSEPERLLAAVRVEDPDYTAKLLSTIDEVIRHYPEYPDSYSMRVDHKYCVNGSEYPGLMVDIDNSIRYGSLVPDNASFLQDLYAERGKIELVRGNHRRAIEDLEHAVRLDPGLAIFLFRVSPEEPKASTPRCEWNIADFDELGREYPADYRVYLFRGLNYSWYASSNHKEYYAKSLVTFQKAIAANPKIGLIYYYLGDAIESTVPDAERFSASSQLIENDRKLLQAYSAALTLDPGLVPAYVARAHIQAYLKHPNLALDDFGKAIALRPNDDKIYNRRAQLLMDVGKEREAIADLSKAIDNCKDEGSLQAYYEERADVSMRVGEYGGAVSDYSKGIELQLRDQGFLFTLRQFRALYPEYDGVSDENFCRKLHGSFWPQFDYEVIAKRLLEKKDEWGLIGLLDLLYEKRGDAYLRANNLRRGVQDFNRLFKGKSTFAEGLDRWRLLGSTSGAEEYYIDVKTVGFADHQLARLWLKTVKKNESYMVHSYDIDCNLRRINAAFVAAYNSKNEVVTSSETGSGWQPIVPDSIGERLYDGMCSVER